MLLIYRAEFTSGKVYEKRIDTAGNFPASFALGPLDMTVERTHPFLVDEYEMSFVSNTDDRFRCITIEIPFDGNAIGDCGTKYIYDNSFNTNMFAGIRKYDSPDKWTRVHDIVLVKSENGELAVAYTTFNRFFTDMWPMYTGITANEYFEDKPLIKGETYRLESISLEETQANDFFERYTKTLASRYVKRERKPVPFGWSSWSCMYGHVTEEILMPQLEELGKLFGENSGATVQIDDGWQGNASFFGNWQYDKNKFPSDDMLPARRCNELGMRYGLWMAPALICEESDQYASQEHLIYRENGEKKTTFATIYPLDLSNPETIKLYRDKFRRCIDKYGAQYFKIDFLTNFLSRITDSKSRLSYPGGYSVEVYKNFIANIREEVGDDVFLLSCGSPMGESIGIFDGFRTSSDITWVGVGNMENMTAWQIFVNNIQNIILRSYYNNALITDPDGLVIRGYRTPYGDDDLVLSYDEARCYATAVAMSGGHILLNEELDKLGEERMKLFTHILPPYGKAARPADFFEFPVSTEAFVKISDGASAVALYNLGDEDRTKVLDTQKYVEGMAAVIDMWTHDVVAVTSGRLTLDMKARSCEAYLVKKMCGYGEEFFKASNFWCGYSEGDRGPEVVLSPADREGFVPYENTAGLNLYIRNSK